MSQADAVPPSPAVDGGAAVDGSQSGRFRPSRSAGGVIDRASYEQLIGLGYLQGYEPAPDASGVTVHVKGRAQPGVNLVVSGHAPEASILDMQGEILHTWRLPPAWEIWSDVEQDASGAYWRRAAVLENGDLLAIYERIGLVKLDKGSNVLWSYRGRRHPHHDLEVLADGRILVLTSERKRIPELSSVPVLDEYVTLLSPKGERLADYSILEMISNSPHAGLLDAKRVRTGGFFGHILHANTVELLSGRFKDRSPAFEKGNVLLSILMLDAVLVVDLDRGTVVAALGEGKWKKQHQPTFLDNGNVLVFDNKYREGCSRVVEFDPVAGEVAWVYTGCEDGAFYSASCGSNQRLANGNTLITETDNGRAFEVTPDKKIVWEYVNPNRAGAERELIASLLEVIRLDPKDSSFPRRRP